MKPSTIKRSIVSGAAAVLLAAAGSLVAVTPASAAPSLPGQVAQWAPTPDVTGDGRADLWVVDTSGYLWVFRSVIGRNINALTDGIEYGGGWSGYTIYAVGDFDRNGHNDLLARDSAGKLWLYPVKAKSYSSGWGYAPVFGTRIQVGNGWSTYKIAVGDFNSDGWPDVQGADSAGNLWFYPNKKSSSSPGFGARTSSGWGWSTMQLLSRAGDYNNDGRDDMIALTSAGDMYLYPGKGGGMFSGKVKIGNGWGSYGKIAGGASFDGSTGTDIIAVYGSSAYLYRGPGSYSYPVRSSFPTIVPRPAAVNSSHATAISIAAQFGVFVVGYSASECRADGVSHHGCYYPAPYSSWNKIAPTIGLNSGLVDSSELSDVTRHEVAHYLIEQTCGTINVGSRSEQITDAYAKLYVGMTGHFWYSPTSADEARAKQIRAGKC